MVSVDSGIPLQIYYGAVVAVLLLLVVMGLISATHIRPFSDDEKNAFYKVELEILKLPRTWLSASMWLLYINNTVMALSVLCSLIVLVMAVNDDIGRHAASVVFFHAPFSYLLTIGQLYPRRGEEYGLSRGIQCS